MLLRDPLILTIFAAFVSGLNAETPLTKVHLTVKVYNYARVPPESLIAGEATAAWIFHRVAIDIQWVDCPISEEDIPKFPECRSVVVAPTVKLLPRSMAEKFDVPAAKYGFALRPNEAFVFVHRIEEVTKDTGFSRPRVLGHVIAHELGHLLLEGENHSTGGIMSARVLSTDCERPGVMLLTFSNSQGQRMRRFIVERDKPKALRGDLSRVR